MALLPNLRESLSSSLDPDDLLLKLTEINPVVAQMIEDGNVGRSVKSGFYRPKKDENGKTVKDDRAKTVLETMNLQTGQYELEDKPDIPAIRESANLREYLERGSQQSFDSGTGSEEARYARKVLLTVLKYAAERVGEITDSISDIDIAMEKGFNWGLGPFKLIDRMGGPQVFADMLRADGLEVPDMIKKADDFNMYTYGDEGQKFEMTKDGNYVEVEQDPDKWMLEDKIRGKDPIISNADASLWDIGDGVVALQLTSPGRCVNEGVIDMINQSVALVTECVERGFEADKNNFIGMVIGDGAPGIYSSGADLKMLLAAIDDNDFDKIENILKDGQDALKSLKFSPFPVVAATSGVALGGGCEIALNSDMVQAHAESYFGLVEIGPGVLPACGGTKEKLIRYGEEHGHSVDTALKVLMDIGQGLLSSSAKSGQEDLMVLNSKSKITMNRERLLPEAKKAAMAMSVGYEAPEEKTIPALGPNAYKGLEAKIEGMAIAMPKLLTPHNVTIMKAVARILTGGGAPEGTPLKESDYLALEQKEFMPLVKSKPTHERIRYAVKTGGKPLHDSQNPEVDMSGGKEQSR